MDFDTLVDTLVERTARMQVKSFKNTVAKRDKAALLDTLVARLSEVKVEKSHWLRWSSKCWSTLCLETKNG